MKNDDNQMGVHLDLICCYADDFTLLGIKIGNSGSDSILSIPPLTYAVWGNLFIAQKDLVVQILLLNLLH
jgi:hypothetical protein